MTLTLVLLFSIVTAVWAAFYSARRLSAPIRDLAEGTAAVAAGDYSRSLPVESRDEMGFLVNSFNQMTRRVASARREVERQREYLETVLRQLSSGVITLSAEAVVNSANDAACALLDVDGDSLTDRALLDVFASSEHLAPLAEALRTSIDKRLPEWQHQVTIMSGDGRRELICRGSTLDPAGERAGFVVVIEDITAVIQGQRDAAWSEVARRLAHEIKNPLTPIQLAAERLRLKYLRKLGEEDGATLERLTSTIIQQVETMKGMVNTFSDYAKSPTVQSEPVDVNEIAGGVADLYRSAHREARIETRFATALPTLSGDPARLRQVFNNLVKNALEASPDGENPHIMITTAEVDHARADHIEVRIEDHGRGIPEEMLANVFEPYVTDKTRGTGLGLAIVKKIIEEHNGVVTMRNRPEGGAAAIIRLPIGETARAGNRHDGRRLSA